MNANQSLDVLYVGTYTRTGALQYIVQMGSELQQVLLTTFVNSFPLIGYII